MVDVNKTTVIAVAGALVLVLAAAGLVELDRRAGPYERDLVDAGVPITVSGTYHASAPTGTQGPLGPCVPTPPATACEPARLVVQLHIDGLPALAPRATYVTYLDRGDGAPYRVGVLRASGQAHVLDHAEHRDARSYDTLLVTLEAQDPATAAGPGPAVYTRDLSGAGDGGPVDLAGVHEARPVAVEGQVRMAELGGVARSVVAFGTLEGVPPPGWGLHAWFVSSTAPVTYTYLGAWTPGEGQGSVRELDARVEHLRLEDQGTFLTTLEPTDGALELAPDAGGEPGFPVALAVLPG